MRKQYYFQPSKNGFYAWDVDKLVELSKALPIISVKLDTIKEIDENFWNNVSPDVHRGIRLLTKIWNVFSLKEGGVGFGKNNTKPTCRSMVEHFKLVNETDLQYPIILSEKGRVMDGMHRVAKALHRDQGREVPPGSSTRLHRCARG